MIEIVEYRDVVGVSIFGRWLSRLDPVAQARILTGLARLEAGNFSQIKGVGAGVFELRLHFGPGYRVYFGKDGEELVILLAGGSKLRQEKDIERAQALWHEFKRSKKER